MPEVIKSTRVLIDGELRPATLHLRDGIVGSITSYDGDEDDVVMPGLVDTHVHVNDPGRSEWEGFETATRAAAAGGVTTIFDMPLNSIPATTNVAALKAKMAAAQGRSIVNVQFIGGVVPGNVADLAPLHDAGITLFKCFLVPSGVDEFPHVAEDDLIEALPVLASLGATLLVHAELPEYLVPDPQGDPRRYATYLASRPDRAETAAVEMVVRVAERFGARVHIVHVSSPETLGIVHAARARGVHITCETCPHYLSFAAEEIGDGKTAFKCAPPIRAAASREQLWDGLIRGDIDLVVSDHSPCPPEMKDLERGDFFRAWGGIASLQLGLPAMWHEARQRDVSIARVAEWMSAAPARLAGIDSTKSRIAVGADADLVVWDPEASFVVDAAQLRHRHLITPYLGRTLTGVVKATYVGGRPVYTNDR
ncbi:MAG: allantoinase AllB [Gemmatimonadota bacterium]|nr:allantoinase AllB [Gemmatimonadota bacterium]